MIDQKDRMIHALFRQEGPEIVVVFARFYGIRGAGDQNSRDWPAMATHMMENKNDKIKLQLSYKYQSLVIVFFQNLYQVVLPLYVFEGLHGRRLTCTPNLTKSQNIFIFFHFACHVNVLI